jgi:HK97 family phage major capsid protein
MVARQFSRDTSWIERRHPSALRPIAQPTPSFQENPVNIDDMIKRLRSEQTTKLAERSSHCNTIATISQTCRTANRNPTDLETTQVRSAETAVGRVDAEVTDLNQRIASLEAEKRADTETDRLSREVHPTGTQVRSANGSWSIGEARTGTPTGDTQRWVRTNDERTATVARTQRFADQEIVRDHINRTSERDAAVVGRHGDLGSLVRSMTTSSGSAIVPTVWSSSVIDRARNKSAVIQAGAEIVPMDAKTVQIGRLTGDPTAAFRTEGSTVTASDPTFDNVTLDAKTQSALVVGSLEWFMDADNVDEVVTNAIAQAIATQLDLVALYGGITTGAGAINLATPPNPRGVLATLNAVAASSVLGGATNGTVQTTGSFYNELIDLIYTPQTFNESPTGILFNAKLGQQLAKSYDTTGQPLVAPADVANLSRYITNQVPSYTQGAMTSRATDAFVGDWSQLLIGQRLDLTIQTLYERYAENGQIGIIAHWRGDIGVARPRAFAVYRAIQGAL